MSNLPSGVMENKIDLRIQRVRSHIEHTNDQQRARHTEIERFRRNSDNVILEREAFHYDSKKDYYADKSVSIGEMTIICNYCKVFKYNGESPGLCCAGGKEKLPQNPLRAFVSGIGNDSKRFLANILKYNNCFHDVFWRNTYCSG